MGEWPQVNWAALAAIPGDGFDIPVGPRRSALGTTALTLPVVDGVGRFPVTNTVAPPPPKPVDIGASLARLDDLEAYRNAEMVGGQIARALIQGMLDSVSNSWIMHRARALEAAGVRVDADEQWERLNRLESQWTHEVHFLLDLAESVSPPDEMPDEFGDVEFKARDGWKISIFYDCGELDYIDHFTRPDDTVVDFWDWPEGTPGRGLMKAWRGVGDYGRLRREVE